MTEQARTIGPATDLVRGYKDAQLGMMYEFRETELWRRGWMIWFDRQLSQIQPAWPCPPSMRSQSSASSAQTSAG